MQAVESEKAMIVDERSGKEKVAVNLLFIFEIETKGVYATQILGKTSIYCGTTPAPR